MVFEYMSQYIGEWKWSVAIVPLILLTIAPTTEAKYDFPVYRLHQYDVAQENYGSRRVSLNFIEPNDCKCISRNLTHFRQKYMESN